MERASRSAEERARDALAFDPLPASDWVRLEETYIAIKTNYSEPLSRLLRSLPASKWMPVEREWRIPYTSADALRENIPTLNELAAKAKENADRETELRKQREAERAAARLREQQERERKRQESKPRALRQEFLTANPDAPLITIELEAIGDNLSPRKAPFGLRMPPRHWVAQIFGSNGRGGWVRNFLPGARDYSKANSVGSRGIMVSYLLQTGPIYEISEPTSWGTTERYFARVVDGKLVRMTADQVNACLI